MTGITYLAFSLTVIGSENGRVDSPPISIISAPSFIIFSAILSAEEVEL